MQIKNYNVDTVFSFKHCTNIEITMQQAKKPLKKENKTFFGPPQVSPSFVRSSG